MTRLSPYILAALLLALGLAGCSKDEPIKVTTQPQQQNPEPKRLLGAQPIRFYNNAEGTPLLAMINDAEKSIDVAIYEMSDTDFLNALKGAAIRGVKVRVIKEPAPLGSKCDLFAKVAAEDMSESCVLEHVVKGEILAAGGSYVPFNKEALCADSTKPCFLHGKMVIVDQKTVLTSTGNFNSSNLCNLSQNPDRCNRDFSTVSTDPELVSFLTKVFELDLKAEKYDLAALFTDSLRSKVTVSPLSLDPIVSLIHSANHSIKIENQYLKDKGMNSALIAAAKRGVKVEVTVASLCAFGKPGQGAAADAKVLFSSFEEAGIDVKMLGTQFKINGKPGYLHAKALLVDDTNAWVGSVNGSFSALSNNREFGMIFSEPSEVEALQKVLSSDHASPDMETWQESLECKKDPATGV